MIALEWNDDTATADLSRNGANLETDEGLETAVIISLFTHESWWGDAYPDEEGHVLGSKLHRLARRNVTQATLEDAQTWTEEALRWLIDDGIAARVIVSAERMENRRDGIVLDVGIEKPGDVAPRWNRVWEVHTNEL